MKYDQTRRGGYFEFPLSLRFKVDLQQLFNRLTLHSRPSSTLADEKRTYVEGLSKRLDATLCPRNLRERKKSGRAEI